jgi:hypothetical protein
MSLDEWWARGAQAHLNIKLPRKPSRPTYHNFLVLRKTGKEAEQ